MARIGKYKLENEIGRGGFGRVFRAYDPTVGRTVAIKVLIADTDQDLLARFRREATATGKLRHKNIVTVYDYGEQDNTPYLVMEYLEGDDLRTCIASGRISTVFEKTSIMAQVAEGLQHAHHQGIVHRDIKPANIMVLADGTVKIMDFGIARVVSEYSTRLTRHGDVIGTLSYMAPEVLQGADVDALCEVFSFGVICYELMGRKHPFSADQPARVIYNITAVQPPPVSTLAPECPPDLDQLISRAMHKERELRYQSFEDLLFDLTPIRLQLQSAQAQTLIRKAETLIDARQVREAQTVIRQVLQLDPNNTLARELRGKLSREAQALALRQRTDQLIASGTEQLNSLRYVEAIEAFEGVLRLDPNNAEAAELLERARTALKKRERAQALIVQAKRELQEDRLTDAYRSALECLQNAPEDNDAASLLETIRAAINERERLRRLTEGLSQAEELLVDHPEQAKALLADLQVAFPSEQRISALLGKAAVAIAEKERRRQLSEALISVQSFFAEKKWSDAAASLRALIQQFPAEAEVRSGLAYAEEQLELQRRTEHIQQILRDAHAANEADDFERALKLLDGALRSYPADLSLKEMMLRTEGLRYERQRQTAIQAATMRANELAGQNDFAAALAVVDLTATTWKTAELDDLRSGLRARQKDFERSQAIARTCASIKLYLERGRFEDALTAGREGLERFPGESSITELVASAQAQLDEQRRIARIEGVRREAELKSGEGRFADAIEILTRAIQELGGESSLTALRAQIEARKQERERQEAIAAAEAKLQAFLKASEFDAAIEAGQAALRRFPGETRLYGLLAAAEKALSEQRRARRIAAIQEQAQALASAKDFHSALKLLRGGMAEVGSEPVLEDLARSIDVSRLAHERQEAIGKAAEEAKQLIESLQYGKAAALLEERLRSYPNAAALSGLLKEAQDRLAAQRRLEAIEEAVRKSRELVQAQDFKAAQKVVRNAVREYSDDARLTAMAAEISGALAEFEKERAVRSALSSAAALEERGEFGKAAELLEVTLTRIPGQSVIQQALAQVREKIATQQKVNAILSDVSQLMSRGNFDQALANVREALTAFPQEPAIAALVGEINDARRANVMARAKQLIDSTQYVKAIALLEESLRSQPNETSWKSLLKDAQVRLAAQQRSDAIEKALLNARELLQGRDFKAALNVVRNAAREYSDDARLEGMTAEIKGAMAELEKERAVHSALSSAAALEERGEFGKAAELLEVTLTRIPGQSVIQHALAQVKEKIATQQKVNAILSDVSQLMSRGDFDQALAKVRQALTAFPEEPAIGALVGEIDEARRANIVARAKQLIDSSEYGKAVALLEESLRSQPNEASLKGLLKEARARLADQQRSEAIEEALRKVRELVQAQDFKAAQNIIRKAAREYSDDARLKAMAAEIKGAMAEVEKERAVRSALNSAAALQERGELGKAAELLELTLTRAPDQTAIQQALALVKEKVAIQQKVNAVLDDVSQLMSRGDFDKALASVQQALTVFPEQPAVRALLDEVHEAHRANTVAAILKEVESFRSSGDIARACARLEEALREFPNEPAFLGLKPRIQAELEEERKRRRLAEFIADIRRLLDQDKVDDALARSAEALREYPKEGELAALDAYAKEIVEARRRAEQIASLIKKASALLQGGKSREAEALLQDALKKHPQEQAFRTLLDRARAEAAALDAQKQTPSANEITSKIQLPPEVLRPAPSTERPAPAAVPRTAVPPIDRQPPSTPRRALPKAVLAGVAALIVAVVIAWLVYPRNSQDQARLDSARSYIEQKDYAKAIDALQQIPAQSALYKQAQDLLTSARGAETQATIESLLDQAAAQHNQNQDQVSLSTLQKVLDLDAGNERAKTLRSEIEQTIYRNRTRAEQEQYATAALAEAQKLLDAGNLDSAKSKIEEIVRLRPNDPLAASLNRRIDGQLQGIRKMDQERLKSAQAKAAAESAKAPELDSDGFAAAQRTEQEAARQQAARQYDAAAAKFTDAARLYGESEKAALAEAGARADRDNQQRAALQAQRTAAETARGQYQQNRTKARDGGADAKAADRYRAAESIASDAQTKLDRNDFAGARAGFDQASNGMAQALDAAAKADQASASRQAVQRTVDSARADMQAAKRTVSGGDARAAAEEARAQQLVQDGKLAEAAGVYQTAASLYRDAAQREGRQKQEQTDQQAIRKTLDQYILAYEQKNLNAMQAVFPQMTKADEDAFRATIKNARTIEVQLDLRGITISGDAARVEARRQMNFRAAIGNQSVSTPQESVVFTLRRSGQSWLIESIAR